MTAENAHEVYQEEVFDLTAAYTITAYATKPQYENSDTVNVTLCRIECAEEHNDGDTNGVITIPSRPVLIQSHDGVITLNGHANGASVAVYDTTGRELSFATSTDEGTATVSTGLTAGSTAIVKIAGRSVKVAIR